MCRRCDFRTASRSASRAITKIAARTTPPIAAIANRTLVESAMEGILPSVGAGAGCMRSALDRLAALRAELHVPRDLVAVRALPELGRAAFSAELQAGRDGLAALDAGLAPRGDRRVGAAVTAELRRHGVHRPALGARPRLLLRCLGDHAWHLRRHPVPEADAGAEADAGPRAAGRVRGRGLHRVREGELLVRLRVRAAEDLRRGHLVEGLLDRVRKRDVQAADLDNL